MAANAAMGTPTTASKLMEFVSGFWLALSLVTGALAGGGVVVEVAAADVVALFPLNGVVVVRPPPPLDDVVPGVGADVVPGVGAVVITIPCVVAVYGDGDVVVGGLVRL